MLVPREELIETDFFECSACDYEYCLWESIIEATGDASFGRRAFAGFSLADMIADFGISPSEIDASEWADMKLCKAEVKRYEQQQAYLRNEEAKAANKK